ncbi:MAG: CDP-alcohol phosphatidyltransferase family protein [Candidatus Saccharibacteria bacterium]
MGLKSFKSVEQDDILTLPNAVSVARGVGGVVLGTLLATKGIDATSAFNVGFALAVSDMEGSTIALTSKFPRLQKALRIIPSSAGRYIDPVADKVFAVSFITGATIAGYEPRWQAAGILATETATAGVSIYKKHKGGDPETSKTGSVGMVVRCLSVAANMAIPAYAGTSEIAHDVLSTTGNVTSVAAIGLGAISCAMLSRTPTDKTPELLPDITAS